MDVAEMLLVCELAPWCGPLGRTDVTGRFKGQVQRCCTTLRQRAHEESTDSICPTLRRLCQRVPTRATHSRAARVERIGRSCRLGDAQVHEEEDQAAVEQRISHPAHEVFR